MMECNINNNAIIGENIIPENRLAMAAIVNENTTAGPATLRATIPATGSYNRHLISD